MISKLHKSMEEKEQKTTTKFKHRLLDKIKEKKQKQEMSQQFQDLHWDDAYEVYYDSSK